MSQGTVKWFNAQKGYGFIQPDDGSKDVFVHITAVERAGLNGLNEGQKVSFDLETRPAGQDVGDESEIRLSFDRPWEGVDMSSVHNLLARVGCSFRVHQAIASLMAGHADAATASAATAAELTDRYRRLRLTAQGID